MYVTFRGQSFLIDNPSTFSFYVTMPNGKVEHFHTMRQVINRINTYSEIAV